MSTSRCINRLHLLGRNSSIAADLPHTLRSSTLRCRHHQPAAPNPSLSFRRTASYQAASSPVVRPAVTPPRPQSSTVTPAKPESAATAPAYQDLSEGLNDFPVTFDESGNQIDWARSFHGLSTQPFSKEAAEVLLQPIPVEDIEVKPDGIVYLPEIKYRRILNKAFGPGGWGLAPRSETIITEKSVTREYALVAHGRLVSVARGEMEYFSPDGIPTATEGVKSNAMMRCCKDLGVASELWDPRFIQKFMAEHAKEIFVEHVINKKRRKIWLRKDSSPRYPYKEAKGFMSSNLGA